LAERRLHVFELLGADDGDDVFHGEVSVVIPGPTGGQSPGRPARRSSRVGSGTRDVLHRVDRDTLPAGGPAGLVPWIAPGAGLLTRSAVYPAGAASAEITYSGYAGMPCSCRSRPSSSPSLETRSLPTRLSTPNTVIAAV